MYWLKWHYHVKDIARAPYKIKQNKTKTKTTESPTVSSHGQIPVILCSTITIAWSLSNDDRKSTVFSSRRNVVSDGAFMTDDGRLFHACAEATGNAWLLRVKHLVDGTQLQVTPVYTYNFCHWPSSRQVLVGMISSLCAVSCTTDTRHTQQLFTFCTYCGLTETSRSIVFSLSSSCMHCFICSTAPYTNTPWRFVTNQHVKVHFKHRLTVHSTSLSTHTVYTHV